jgi:hypothetical protein
VHGERSTPTAGSDSRQDRDRNRKLPEGDTQFVANDVIYTGGPDDPTSQVAAPDAS